MWQASHWALVGMWVVGLLSAVVPLWQLEQLPTAVASWDQLVVAHEVVDIWQPTLSHVVLAGGIATCVTGLIWALMDRSEPL